MVAVGGIARFAEEHVRRPVASREASLRVVAPAAETREIVDGAFACEAQRRGALPDVSKGVVAHVAADVVRGRKRRARFDVAVRLDAERDPARAARAAVATRVVPAQNGL